MDIVNKLQTLLEGFIGIMGNHGFNLLFILMAGGSLLLLAMAWKSQHSVMSLFRTTRTKLETLEKKEKYQLQYFINLRKRVDYFFVFKSNKRQADYMYVGILLVELGLFAAFMVASKVLLAILFPLVVHWFALKALELASDNIHMYIQKELPVAIKQLIKVMTKTNDLKTIMYEVSGTMREPLRSKFFDLARKMITENHERCLLEFAEDLDDTWMYAFVFMLISYKEQSKKSDIISNLATLAEMLENENYQRDKALLEKKSVVILNYGLVAIALVCLVANFMFNDYAKDFFLNSIGGMLAFVMGCAAVLGTFLLNLILSRKTF